jgi:hypothetical protein
VSAYNGRGTYRRSAGSGGGSRWMNLRYAGVCKVCGNRVAAGDRGYWDASARTVTCPALACCEANGLTTVKLPTGPWDGPPDQRITVRADQRVGAAAPFPPRVIVTRFNSGSTIYQNARGRCEDAPCCGCCD